MAGAPSPAQWEEIFNAILGKNDADRREAESVVAEMKEHPGELVSGYMHILTTSDDKNHRGLAAVMLRQYLLDVDQKYFLVPREVRQEVKVALLDMVRGEGERRVRRPVCTLLAEMYSAEEEEEGEEFAELLPWVEECCRVDGDPKARCAALKVLEELSFVMGQGMEEEDLVALAGMIEANMRHEPLMVQVDAARAAATLLVSIEKGSSRVESVLGVVGPMFEVLVGAADMGRSDEVLETSSLLVDGVALQPDAFRGVFEEAARTSLSMAGEQGREVGLGDKARRMTMELAVTLCENLSPLARKIPDNGFAQLLLEACWAMLLEPGVDAHWAEREESEEDDPLDNVEAARTAIDRCGQALGEDRLASLILSKEGKESLSRVAAKKEVAEWMVERAYVDAVGAISHSVGFEATAEDLCPIAMELVDAAENAHERVRHSAATSISFWANVHGPTFQDSCVERALPALIRLVQDDHPRVRSQGCAALVSFADKCIADRMEPFAEDVLVEMTRVLQHGATRTEREWALAAVSSMAAQAQTRFRHFLDDLLPLARNVALRPVAALGLADAHVDEDAIRAIQSKGIEAYSVLVRNVAFGDDGDSGDAAYGEARALVENLLELADSLAPPGDHDPVRGSLFEGLLRGAQCLLAQYEPYLIRTLELLADTAQREVDAVELDPNEAMQLEADIAEGMADPDVRVVEDGDRRFRVGNAAVQDKILSTRTLAELLHVLGITGVFDHEAVKLAAEALISLVDNSSEIAAEARHEAMGALSDLLGAAALAQIVNGLESADPKCLEERSGQLAMVLEPLLRALGHTKDPEVISDGVIALKFCLLEACGHREIPPGLDLDPKDPEVAKGIAMQVARLDNGDLRRLNSHFHSLLDRDMLVRIVQTLRNVLARALQAIATVHAEQKLRAEDMDDVEEERAMDILQLQLGVRATAADTLGSVIRTHGAMAAEVVLEVLGSEFDDWRSEGASSYDAKLAVFIMDDILEHGGEVGRHHAEDFIPALIHFATIDSIESPDMGAARQAAVFGLGSTAWAHPKLMQPYLLEAAGALLSTAEQTDAIVQEVMESLEGQDIDMNDVSFPGDANMVFDNAVSALGRLLHASMHNKGGEVCEGVDADDALSLWQQWLGHLPLHFDVTECRVAVQVLCERISLACPYLLGGPGLGIEDGQLTHVLRVLAQAIFDESTSRRFLQHRVLDAVRAFANHGKDHVSALSAAVEAVEADDPIQEYVGILVTSAGEGLTRIDLRSAKPPAHDDEDNDAYIPGGEK